MDRRNVSLEARARECNRNKNLATHTIGVNLVLFFSRFTLRTMWDLVPKDHKDEVERIACWDMLLGDTELANLIGNADEARGLA